MVCGWPFSALAAILTLELFREVLVRKAVESVDQWVHGRRDSALADVASRVVLQRGFLVECLAAKASKRTVTRVNERVAVEFRLALEPRPAVDAHVLA